MPDSNGGGRLDRIEALLEKTAERLDRVATSHYLHETRLTHIEALQEENALRWKENELRWKEIREEMRERERRLDERIERLVEAIGKLISVRQTAEL